MTAMTECCRRRPSPRMTACCRPGWSLRYDLLLHARGASHPALSSWQRLRAGGIWQRAAPDQEEMVNNVKRKCKKLEDVLVGAELFYILFNRTQLRGSAASMVLIVKTGSRKYCLASDLKEGGSCYCSCLFTCVINVKTVPMNSG